jgi:LEA14-like dessication related protein
MKRCFLFALLPLMLVSCKDFKEPELRGIESVKVNTIGLGGSVITLNVKYFNPNRFNAHIKDAQGDAWMDSVFLGHFTVDSLIAVPKENEFLVPVKLSLDMKFVLQNTLAAFSNKEVVLKILGTAKAGRNGFYKKFPLKYEGRQNLKRLFGQEQ